MCVVEVCTIWCVPLYCAFMANMYIRKEYTMSILDMTDEEIESLSFDDLAKIAESIEESDSTESDSSESDDE